MYQDYDEVPANHAPTYNDVPIHPLLAAINGNMDKYANAQDRGRYQNHFSYPMPPMADGTHLYDSYPTGAAAGWGVGQTGSGGTGQSGYGYESHSGDAGGGGHEYHPPVHVPTGGSYSHHTTGGTSYGGYAPTPPKHYARPQPTLPSKGGGKKKKKKNNSNANTMNALTLLAFFFFINLLQNCLKDNMEAMNPTVMVMTAKTARNRNNKLAEINSREQSTSSASAFTSGANIVVQPEDVVSAAAAAAAAASVTSVNSVSAVVPPVAGANLQTSPYSDGGGGGGGVPSVPGSANVGNSFAGGVGVTSGNSNNNNYNNNQQSNNGQNNVFHQPGEPQFSYGSNTGNAVQQHYGGLTSNYNQPNNHKHSYNQANDENRNPGQYQFAPAPSVRPGIVTAIRDPRPGLYDAEHSYPNQTINSATTLSHPHNFNQHVQQQQQQQHNTGYPHEHFEQEEYEPQLPQPQVEPQTEHHQHHFDQNHFQQHQHQHQQQQQQHYHDLNQPRPINHDQYDEDHHQQAPPHDHFQHHYGTHHHSQQPSSFYSDRHQQQHYLIDRHPLRPHRGQSESSHPWSYVAGSSSSNAYKRGSYTWSSDSSPAHVSGHNNFGDSEDDDVGPYADAFYTRSNKRL